MAGSAQIGSLRVALGLDSAQFENGAAKIQSSLSTLSGSFKAFAANAVAALSVGALTNAFSSIVDHMDELGKAAQKIGIPVDELSKLEYAAKLADLPLESLQTSVVKLSKGLAEFQSTGKGAAGGALQAIGVEALTANGKLRPTSNILADIAEKFAGMKDGANKTALAVALFGKAGADMIVLLNGGKQSLVDASSEATLFGIVVNSKASRAAENFNDNLTRLHEALTGFIQQGIVILLPRLVEMTNAFVDFSKSDAPRQFFQSLSVEIQNVSDSLATSQKELQGFYSFLVDGPKFLQPYIDSADKALGIGKYNQQRQVNDDKNLLHPALKFVESGKGDLGPVGPLKDGPALPSPEVHAAKLIPLKKSYDDLAAAAKRAFDSTRTPMENQNIRLAELKKLLSEGRITQDTYNRAVQQAKTDYVNAANSLNTYESQIKETTSVMEEFGAIAKDAFSSWIDSAIDGTFNLKNSLVDLAKQLLKFEANNALKLLLNGGGQTTNPLYGGSSGGGFVDIFKSLLGFSSGGTILPSGGGSIDSQVVMFKKRPDEQVNVGTPGQLGGGRSTMKVIVNNYGREPVQTSQDGSGAPIINIGKILTDKLEGEYGLRKVQNRRV